VVEMAVGTVATRQGVLIFRPNTMWTYGTGRIFDWHSKIFTMILKKGLLLFVKKLHKF